MRFNTSPPLLTSLLCLLIFITSSFVAYEVNGSIWTKVRILDLKEFGGVTFEQLSDLEFWRLISSQLVHVKPMHMLFNIISLFFIGSIIEKRLGGKKLLLLFFISGVIGTLASTLGVASVYAVGTGASQAIFGLIGCGALFVIKGINNSTWLKVVLLFCLTPALALDIIYAGYPKQGHIIGFLVGIIISLIFLSNCPNKHIDNQT